MNGGVFTRASDSLASVLWSRLGISSTGLDDGVTEFEDFKGIWDTGATHSVITQAVVDSLDLKSIEKVIVQHAHGRAEASVYLVNFALPCGVAIPNLRVTMGNLGGEYDVLIGMDVIGRGDFAVSNFNGRTVFGFRVPSAADVDWTV